jgi:ribosomal protein S18 acetylase RimI-like enzyme
VIKTEIRAAEPNDLPALLEMGRQFFEHSGNARFTTFDEPSLTATLIGLISGVGNGVVLATEVNGDVVGMAACVVFPFYANMNTLIGQEIFLWVDPAYRGAVGEALLDELEAAALRKGAKVFINANLAGERDAAFARYYRRRGCVPAENTHIKVLSS